MGRKMKDSGVEWIGEIPEDWQINKLKYVADFEPSSREKESKLDEKDLITYTPMECIKNGKFDNRSIAYGKISTSLTRFQEGDICIAKVTPCFENGNIAIMENLHNGFGMGSSELFVIRPKEINKKYLFYWLMNQDFVQHGCATMTGTGGLKRVDSRYVKNTYLHYPSYSEQEKISRYLDEKCSEIDKNISDNYNSIECYKSLKQSLITRAVTKGVRGKREMKDSGIEWVKEIPYEWDSINPKALFKQRKDRAKEGEKQLTASQKYGVIYQEEYMELTGNSVVLVEKDFSILKHVEAGDFVISMRSFQGGLEYSDNTGSISSAYVMLIPNKGMVYPPFYKWLFKSSLYINALQSTSDLVRDGQAMRYSNFAKVRIYSVPIEEQREIAEYLDEKCFVIDTLIAKKEQLLTELEAYKKSLIYEYVTGKREVLA